MLSAAPYYWGTIRKIVVAFGTIFSDIHIVRINTAGVPVQAIEVPCEFGPKEKWVTRNVQNPMPGVDDQVEMLLPRLAYEIVSFNYDTSRKLTSTGTTVKAITNNSRVVATQFNPVPYNLGFSLYVMTKTLGDGLMIVEQILPFFTPDYTIKVVDIPALNLTKDIPIILNGISFEDSWDGTLPQRRTMIWTLQFTVKAYLYPPSPLQGLNLNTNIFWSTNNDPNVVSSLAWGNIIPNATYTDGIVLSGGQGTAQFVFGTSRIQVPENIQTLTGISNILAAADAFAPGFDPGGFQNLVTTWNLEGTSLITNTTVQNLSGVSNVRNPLQFLPGFMEFPLPTLTLLSERVQFGVSNIKNTTSQNLVGVSNILNTTDQNEVGVSRIQITTPQSQIGVSDLQATTQQDLSGVSTIEFTIQETYQFGISTIINGSTVHILEGVSNVYGTTEQDLNGITNIQPYFTTIQNLNGVSNIVAAFGNETTYQTQDGVSTAWLGENIMSAIFPRTDFGNTDYQIELDVTFNQVVNWTGIPVIYTSYNGQILEFTPSNYPFTGQTLTFKGYPYNPNQSPIQWNAGELIWGSPDPQTATNLYSIYNGVSILFSATTPGVAGDNIQITFGNVIGTDGSNNIIEPNVPFSITVLGHYITIIGATDNAGNEITTGQQFLDACGQNDAMSALVNVQIFGMSDLTQALDITDPGEVQYLPLGPPTSVSNLGGGFDVEPGGIITDDPTASPPAFTYDSGIPNPGRPDTIDLTFAIPSNIGIENISWSQDHAVTLQTQGGISEILNPDATSIVFQTQDQYGTFFTIETTDTSTLHCDFGSNGVSADQIFGTTTVYFTHTYGSSGQYAVTLSNGLENILSLDLEYANAVADIPSFATCLAITSITLPGCSFTGTQSGSFATQLNLATLNLADNELDQPSVDQVLADLVDSLTLPGRVACTVDLSGNATPSGTGLTNKATLNGTAGWSVTTA